MRRALREGGGAFRYFLFISLKSQRIEVFSKRALLRLQDPTLRIDSIPA